MARKSKNEVSLTIDEKITQALVPDVEQPYIIPKNWCWTRVSHISEVVTGGTPSKKQSEYYGGSFPFFKPTDLNAGRNVFYASEYLSEKGKSVSRIIPAKSSAVCCIGSIGKCGFLLREGTTNQQINSAIPKIEPLFLFYYFSTVSFLNDLLSKVSSTTISIVNKSKMKRCLFPLAPLDEQQRIVERIESLFAKLDEAKEKAQEVIDGFEERRSAILSKAFSGELTQEWRKTNGITTDSWSNKSINSICRSLKYGTAKKSESSGPVVVIRMGNLQQGEIDWSDLAYTTDKADIEKYHLKPNDVLFNRTNSAALVGKTSIYRGEYPAIYAGYLIKLDYDHEIVIGDYLNYALNTLSAKRYCNSVKTDGVNQSNINAKKIGAYIIPVPSIKEQEIIVDTVKSLLSKEQKAKETAEQVVEQIDAMKKAILARAFRGELGTNDPNDEPAIELLKRVIHDQ